MSDDDALTPVPSLAPAAAARIKRIAVRYGSRFEFSYRGTWNSATQQITAVELLSRGSRDRCTQHTSQFTAGDVALHTHPVGVPTEPSHTDLDAAATFAANGVGFAIASHDGQELFVVYTPNQAAARLPVPTAAERHRRRTRRITVGPLSLLWYPGLKQATITY